MGRGYEFRADVKLLNDIPGKVWQNFKVVLKFSFTAAADGTSNASGNKKANEKETK
jgi:hypothetical protein